MFYDIHYQNISRAKAYQSRFKREQLHDTLTLIHGHVSGLRRVEELGASYGYWTDRQVRLILSHLEESVSQLTYAFLYTFLPNLSTPVSAAIA